MRRSDLVQTPSKGSTPRTTQIVFGERQHLLRVLDSLETTAVPQVRLNQERRVIEELIHERTRELNHINSSWDEKVGLVLNADSKSEMLDKLEREAPAIRFLPAAPDQRASESHVQDAGPPGQASLRRDPRKCRAPSERRPHHARLARERPQPAAVVSRGVQSQYARRPAPQITRPPAQAGAEHFEQVGIQSSDVVQFPRSRLIEDLATNRLLFESIFTGSSC